MYIVLDRFIVFTNTKAIFGCNLRFFLLFAPLLFRGMKHHDHICLFSYSVIQFTNVKMRSGRQVNVIAEAEKSYFLWVTITTQMFWMFWVNSRFTISLHHISTWASLFKLMYCVSISSFSSLYCIMIDWYKHSILLKDVYFKFLKKHLFFFFFLIFKIIILTCKTMSYDS